MMKSINAFKRISILSILSFLIAIVYNGCLGIAIDSNGIIPIDADGYADMSHSESLNSFSVWGYWAFSKKRAKLYCLDENSQSKYLAHHDYPNQHYALKVPDVARSVCKKYSHSSGKEYIVLRVKIDNQFMPIMTQKNLNCINYQKKHNPYINGDAAASNLCLQNQDSRDGSKSKDAWGTNGVTKSAKSVNSLRLFIKSVAKVSLPLRILSLGDSITHGVEGYNSYRKPLFDLIRNGGHRVEYIGSHDRTYTDGSFILPHDGHSGWRVDHILYGHSSKQHKTYLSHWLTSYTPDIVLMHLGTNDILQDNSNSSTIYELRGVINTLRKDNENVKIFMAKIIPVRIINSSDSEINDRIRSLNSSIGALASEMNSSKSRVIIVDQYSGYNAQVLNHDRAHPNTSGEKRMAQKWYEVVRTHLN